jgi:RNA polymerase sigma-70 factor (ECF subfamily)
LITENNVWSSMDEPTASFEQLRPQLFQVAYGILGGVADAEEVVQEAWLRWRRADSRQIENLRAWLTTVVARLALDILDSARRRRENYVGEWLPEPLVAGRVDEGPEERITLDESVAAALLIVLERLSPAERTAFLLHDSFGMPFVEVAELVGRSPDSVRQLAARARRNVAAAKPRFPASREEQEGIISAFGAACAAGSLEQLLAVLDPEVVMRSDGGGRVPSARFPLRGAERVAGALIALERKRLREGRPFSFELANVNGALGVVCHDGLALNVMSFGFDGGRIVAIDNLRNPEKLTHVTAPGMTSGA